MNNNLNKNQIITELAYEIMVDITNERLALHSILLKASRLSLLLDTPKNVELFKSWSKFAEQNSFVLDNYKHNILSASDRNVSITSANPEQYVHSPMGNNFERNGIRSDAKTIAGYTANYRAETYKFVSDIYSKYTFGNIAQSVFERKRKLIDNKLISIFPDVNSRINSIEQNMLSENEEDWKNAIVSCRTLLMDFADVVNPPKSAEEKNKYINRLKDYISPKIESATNKSLYLSMLEELKIRIELTSNLTQGSAHKDRKIKNETESIILLVYLVLGEIALLK